MKKLLVGIGLLVSIGLVLGFYRQMTNTKSVLVVYSPHHTDFIDALTRHFEEQYPEIKIQLVSGSTTLLEERIRSERSKPLGDVIFGGDVNTYIQLKKDGLIQSMPLSAANKLPTQMKDKEGFWYAPYRLPGVFFYNNQLVSAEQAPQDWEDLLNVEWKDALMLINPTISGTARTFYISLISIWGEKRAFDYFKQLDRQVNKSYVMSSDKLMAAITRGEAKVSMWNEADILKAKYQKMLPFGVIYPRSGTYMNPEPIAVIAGAPHKDHAQKYLEFIFEEPTLALTANTYMKRPARIDFPKDQLPEPLRFEPTTFPIDWSSIGDQGAAWLKKWSEDVWHKKAS